MATVRAPFDGRVVSLKTAIGQFASAMNPIFTLIDTRHWYVTANFRETELKNIQTGTPASLRSMGDSSKTFSSKVDSIGYGVLPDDGGMVLAEQMSLLMLDSQRVIQSLQLIKSLGAAIRPRPTRPDKRSAIRLSRTDCRMAASPYPPYVLPTPSDLRQTAFSFVTSNMTTACFSSGFCAKFARNID